jgi:N-acetylglucosamine kinase-like BadF-type ATPase
LKTILGIDGGGTNTRGIIQRGTETLAHVRGGSIKRLRVGAEQAATNLKTLMRELYQQAKVHSVDAASAGIASASLPGVAEWITDIFRDFDVATSEVVGDEVIALDAAFHGGAGILQIAGTGSNCIGRTTTGVLESAGGYSSTLGDEGSGYWIGLHAVRRGLRAHDRNEQTRILDEVRSLWQTPTLTDLVLYGNATPGPDFAALAPVVAQLAMQGDLIAQGVLEQAAIDLADFVLTVHKKLRRLDPMAAEVPVAWTGSVLEKIDPVRERFMSILREAVPGMVIATSPTVAINGALWRAQQLADR